MYPWKRGCHPMTRGPSILPPPARVLLPLEPGQTALVSTGEAVRLGQKIAGGAVPLHASVSGTVSAIVPHNTAGGRHRSTFVLENDGLGRPDPSIRPRPLLDELSEEALLRLLYEAGIRLSDGTPLAAAVGAGIGAALAISAMEEVPGDRASEAALLYDQEACLSGVWLLARLLQSKSVSLVLGREQRAAIQIAKRCAGAKLRLCIVGGPWPVGERKRLGALLAEDGADALVLPASAASACAHACYESIPVLSETVTLNWDGGQALYQVPLGTPVRELLSAARRRAGLVLLGSPLAGNELGSLDVPLVQGMTCLTLLEREEAPARTACIRCGRCASVCPAGLWPYRSQRRGRARDWSECLYCGACQYACPAGIPLLDDIGREVRRLG